MSPWKVGRFGDDPPPAVASRPTTYRATLTADRCGERTAGKRYMAGSVSRASPWTTHRPAASNQFPRRGAHSTGVWYGHAAEFGARRARARMLKTAMFDEGVDGGDGHVQAAPTTAPHRGPDRASSWRSTPTEALSVDFYLRSSGSDGRIERRGDSLSPRCRCLRKGDAETN